MVKNSPAYAGDAGSIPGSGRSSGEGNGNPLQYSCQDNSMYRGAWWTTVHGLQRVRHDLGIKQQHLLTNLMCQTTPHVKRMQQGTNKAKKKGAK